MPRLANRQNRPAGVYLSSEVAAPVRGSGEATMYRAVLDLDPADLADSTLTISVTLEGSIDHVTWREFARIDGWQGGTVGRDGTITPPHVSWAASDNRVLARVRVRWVQSKTARAGASLETELVTGSAGSVGSAGSAGTEGS